MTAATVNSRTIRIITCGSEKWRLNQLRIICILFYEDLEGIIRNGDEITSSIRHHSFSFKPSLPDLKPKKY